MATFARLKRADLRAVIHKRAVVHRFAATAACHPANRGRLPGMTNTNQIVGRYGERLAGRHLLARGLVLLDRNWRCPSGELDLVARDGPELVFVEVKTRRSVRFGTPVEAVGADKARRLRRLATRWLAAHGATGRPIRFDVVSVLLGRDTVGVEHLRGVL